MSKKFGQNFLINRAFVNRIIELLNINSDSVVWEIGPGLGALTSEIIKKKSALTCFEIDYGFAQVLEEQAFKDEKFSLIRGDFLKTFPGVFGKDGIPDVICGNLPYNVGATIIASLVNSRCTPPLMVFTLQSEVAQRICASKGDKLYSSFSLTVGLDYVANIEFDIPPSSFWPEPNVESSVVVLKKRKTPLLGENEVKTYLSLVKNLFSQRRKTISNNLKSYCSSSGSFTVQNLLESVGLTGSERAQELDSDSVIRLAGALSKYNR